MSKDAKEAIGHGILASSVEHRTTGVKRPPSNAIVERLHRTLRDEPLPRRGPDPYHLRS